MEPEYVVGRATITVGGEVFTAKEVFSVAQWESGFGKGIVRQAAIDELLDQHSPVFSIDPPVE